MGRGDQRGPGRERQERRCGEAQPGKARAVPAVRLARGERQRPGGRAQRQRREGQRSVRVRSARGG